MMTFGVPGNRDYSGFAQSDAATDMKLQKKFIILLNLRVFAFIILDKIA